MDNNTRIIAVANEKGGVGKTVTAINLGAALSERGKRVLLVDMDPQFNATRGLGLDSDNTYLTTYDLLKGDQKVKVEDAILATQWDNLYLIPSHVDLAGAEIELISKIGRENKLKRKLGELTQTFDYILLDTPPSLSLLTVNVFAYAKEVVIPCQTHPYAFAALDELFDTIDTIKAEINPSIEVAGIVATFFDQRTRVSQLILDKLKAHSRYQKILFDTVIRINTTIAESAENGRPVIYYRRSSYGAYDYQRLADELANRLPQS